MSFLCVPVLVFVMGTGCMHCVCKCSAAACCSFSPSFSSLHVLGYSIIIMFVTTK